MEENTQKILKDILEMVSFIKENAATKDELKNFVTKDDFKGFSTKDDLKGLATKEDFRHLDKKIDDLRTDMNARFDELQADLSDIKERLVKLELHTKRDLDAYASDILVLQKKVHVLEQKILEFQKARA